MYFFGCTRVAFLLFLQEIDKSVPYVMAGFSFFAFVPAGAQRGAFHEIIVYGNAVMLNAETLRFGRGGCQGLSSEAVSWGVTSTPCCSPGRWWDHPCRGHAG